MVFAADYPFLDVFWTMIIFFCWVIWIWVVITILADVFSRHDIGGWAKAAWVVFVVILPWLGALIYLIARGRSMNERARQQAERNEQAFRQYVQQAATDKPSTADELAKLADLRDRGTISEQEFAQAKARLLGTRPNDGAELPVDRRTSTV